MKDIRAELSLPDEPREPRAETRALLEDSPEEGARLLEAGHPLAGLLWEEWGAELEAAGMDRERFLQITRRYAGEIRLWVMGERPWDHCVAGLAGRVQRRLPQRREKQEPKLASSGACR
ncbi:MAG: hypothetical protein QOI57_1922 [Rubrobacteraceae bacterium]|nr:hypothetical protein [Rubrobacteraceae bacterium]